MRWNFYANSEFKECLSIEKIKEHREFQKNMSLLTENEFFKVTGCPRPCSYFKYKVVGSKGLESFDEDGDGNMEFGKVLGI